jgi:hypothetical protein
VQKNDKPLDGIDDVMALLVNLFLGENGHLPRSFLSKVRSALEQDIASSGLPNEYECHALVGMVPADGGWPESVDDYGCPEEVSARFPATNEAIEAYF